jgi:hypothetical protein
MRQKIESFSPSRFTIQAVDAVNVKLQIKLLSSAWSGLYPACPKVRYGYIGGSATIAPETAPDNPLNYVIPFICVIHMLKVGDSLTMVQKTGGHKYISFLVNRDIFRQSPLFSTSQRLKKLFFQPVPFPWRVPENVKASKRNKREHMRPIMPDWDLILKGFRLIPWFML